MTDAKRPMARAIKSNQRDIRTVCYPGTDIQVGLLVLHCSEIQEAYFAARDWFERKRQPVDDYAQQQFSFELDYQLLYRMLLEPDSKNPVDRVFRSPDEVRKILSPDEAGYLIEQHAKFQREIVDAWGLGVTVDPHLRAIGTMLGADPNASAEDIVETIKLVLRDARSV